MSNWWDDAPPATAELPNQQQTKQSNGGEWWQEAKPYEFDPERATSFLFDQARQAAFKLPRGGGKFDERGAALWSHNVSGLADAETSSIYWDKTQGELLRQFPDVDQEQARATFGKLQRFYRTAAVLFGDAEVRRSSRDNFQSGIASYSPRKYSTEDVMPRNAAAAAEQLPAEDRELFLGVLQDYAERRDAKDERDLLVKATTRFNRGRNVSGQSLRNVVREFTPAHDWMHGKEAVDKGRFADEIASVVRGNDRDSSSHWLTRAFLGAVEQVPNLAASAGVGGMVGDVPSKVMTAAGLAQTGFWWTQTAPQLKADILKLGVAEDTATKVAGVAAIPIAAIETLQFGQLLPGAAKAVKERATAYARTALLDAAKRGAATYAKEMGEEAAQGLLGIGAQAVAVALDEQAPGLGKEWYAQQGEQFIAEMGEAALSLPFLMAPGQAVDAAASVSQAQQTKRRAPLTAAVLRTPEGAAAYAAADPEGAAAILANPSRRNIARLTSTRQEQWADSKRREALVAGLKTAAAQPPAAPEAVPQPEASTNAEVPTQTPVEVQVPPFEQAAAPAPQAVEQPLPPIDQPPPASEATTPATEPAPQGLPAVGTRVRVKSASGKDWGESTVAGYDEEGRVLFETAIKTGTKRAKLEGVQMEPIGQASAAVEQPTQPEPIPEQPQPQPKQADDAARFASSQGKTPSKAKLRNGEVIWMNPLALASGGTFLDKDGNEIDAKVIDEFQDSKGAILWSRAATQLTKPLRIPQAKEVFEPATLRPVRDELSKHGVDFDMVKEPGEVHKKAIDFAKSLGLTPHVVRFKKGSDWANGWTVGKTVLLDANLPSDQQIWYIVGHEIAHGTSLDRELQLDEETAAKWLERYRAGHGEGTKYRAYLDANPDKARNEAVAHMIGTFMTDEAFRSELQESNPGLFQRIVQILSRFFSGKKLTKEARTALNALKAKKAEATPTKQEAASEAEWQAEPEPMTVEEPQSVGQSEAEEPAPKEETESEKNIRIGRDTAERAAVEKAQEARQRAIDRGREVRFWKHLKEQAKAFAKTGTKREYEVVETRKGEDGKKEEVRVKVQGLQFGPWGIHETKGSDKDEQGNYQKPEKWFTLTHIPSGLEASSYKKQSDAVELLVLFNQSGADWSQTDVDKIMEEGRRNGYSLPALRQAFDNEALGQLTDEARENLLSSVPAVDTHGIEADMLLDSTALGVGTNLEKSRAIETIKMLAKEVPEFRYNPVFTHDGKGLVFRDGYKFLFPAEMFGVAAGELAPGQTVGVILPDFGIDLATPQDVVKEMLANVGFKTAKMGSNVKANWRGEKVMLTGHGENWRIYEGKGEAKDRAQKVLDAIRWKQPGQVDAPLEAKGPSIGYLLPQDTKTYRPTGATVGNIKEQKADARKAKRGAAKKAQAAADAAAKKQEGMGFGPFNSVLTKQRGDAVPDEAKVPNEDVEARMDAAHGLRRRPLLERALSILGVAKNKATRAQEFLPNTQEWAYENEWFRLLKEISQAQQDETLRTIAAIVDPIAVEQRPIFERKLMIDNLIAAYRRGEPLRFGFQSLDEMLAYSEQLGKTIEKSPVLQEALKTRADVVKELVAELVDFGILDQQALDNAETYFHHMVLSKYDADSRTAAGANRPTTIKYGFQRKRVQGDELGAEYDPNTDWIQAEAEWMMEARVALAKAKALEDLEDRRDQLPNLREAAKKQNYVALVGGEANYKRIQELRGLIKESQESEDADESGEKQMRAKWIEELSKLDPLYPFRIKIAMHVGRIMRAWGKREFTAPGFEDMLDARNGEEVETDGNEDLDGQWFEFLKWAASERGDEKEGIAAKGIFKTIGERNQFIKDELGDRFVTWQHIVPETHAVYQPEPGNYFYQALTIPEQVAEQIQRGIIGEINLTADELREVLVMAGPKKQLVLKRELVDQLNTLRKVETPNAVAAAAEKTLSMWKRWQLLKPLTNLGYFARNMLSDVEAAFGSDFGIARHVPQAFKELADYYQAQQQLGLGNAAKLSMSDELRAARDYGVLAAGMAANEIPDIAALPVFQRFYAEENSTLGTKLAYPYQKAKEFHKFREAVARYAAFLRYRDLIRSGKLVNYGGAKLEVVKAIKNEMGVDAAAAHLSRNLLGDYGNLTVLGNWLRAKAMPFWSFNEINLKRLPRMIANARLEGKAGGGSDKRKQLILTTTALMRLSWLAGAAAIWNRLFWQDEEDDLGEYDRAKVHLITGRNPDGSVKLIRNISAAGDFLEWFGVNTIVSLLDNVQAGQMTIGEAFEEAAKDPLNKLAQGVGPQFKLPLELATGKSMFPDVLNPRSTDREELLVQNLGVRDEYLTLKGELLGTGQRGKPHYLQRLTGQSVVDPRENALVEVYELRDRYLKREGKDLPSGDQNFKNMRQAAATGDVERFAEARAAYLRSGKGYKNFESSLRRLDPVAGAMNAADEAKFVQQFLTPVQRQRLDVARQHARNLEVWMRAMWKQAGASQDAPEQRAAEQHQRKESLMNAADTLAEAPPLKIAQRNEWKSRGQAAANRIKAEGVSVGNLRAMYWRYLQSELKDPAARAARYGRFTQRLLQSLRGS